MKLRIIAAALAAAVPALCIADDGKKYDGQDPAGTIAYSLPATSFVFEVEAECETFHAGPYAKFASKYLGIEVPQKDENICRITSVGMNSYTEADLSARYLLDTGNKDIDISFLRLATCGLVSVADTRFGGDVAWRFPVPSRDSRNDAVVSNIASEDATLYRKGEGTEVVAVRQSVMVAKTLEQKAAETASLIFELRKKRMQIITGDTDATYSGEAMGAAVNEISRLENEYMSMFTGYSEKTVQKMTFDVVPEKDKKMYVVFRISETAGLLPPDDISGKPVALEIVPQAIAPAEETAGKSSDRKAAKNAVYAVYRIPAVCTLRLTDGKNLLYHSRQPVYQFGTDSTFPLNVKLK